jgi:hypothetical protein
MTAIRIAFGALVLLAVTAAPVAADHGYWPDAGVDAASVTGHQPASEGSRNPDQWGPDCVAVETLDVYGHVLDANYQLAVVVAEVNGQEVRGPFAVTIFDDPKAGEFLWADVDGDKKFAGHEADAAELIFCRDASLPTTPPSDTVASGILARRGAATPAIPIGLPIVCAAIAIVAHLWRRWPRRERPEPGDIRAR